MGLLWFETLIVWTTLVEPIAAFCIVMQFTISCYCYLVIMMQKLFHCINNLQNAAIGHGRYENKIILNIVLLNALEL